MGYLGHWTMTHNAKTGCKLWLDGRPIFQAIAGLEDSRVSDDQPEPNWWLAAKEVVRRMNEDQEAATDSRRDADRRRP